MEKNIYILVLLSFVFILFFLYIYTLNKRIESRDLEIKSLLSKLENDKCKSPDNFIEVFNQSLK